MANSLTQFASIISVGLFVAVLMLGARALYRQAVKLNKAGYLRTRPALSLAAIVGAIGQMWLLNAIPADASPDVVYWIFGVGLFAYSLIIQLLVAVIRHAIARTRAVQQGWEAELALHQKEIRDSNDSHR